MPRTGSAPAAGSILPPSPTCPSCGSVDLRVLLEVPCRPHMIVASEPGQGPNVVFAPVPKTEIEPTPEADALCSQCDHRAPLATFWPEAFSAEPDETPHLSKRVYDLLRDAGWAVDEEARTITGRVRRIAQAGTVSDGTRIVTLR